MTQQPLQVSVAAPRLELRLHVPTQGGLGPHQAALVVLHAHDALRVIQAAEAVGDEGRAVQQVRERDDDGGAGLLLEAHLAVPGHVLDGEQRAVGQHDHVEVAVGDEHAVRGLDDLREDVLDRIERVVAVLLWAAVADEDGPAALGPVDVEGGVHGLLHVCAVEVDGLARVDVGDVRWEAEHVGGDGALRGDLVDVRARVDGVAGVDDHVEDVTRQIGRAAVVEEGRGLQARGREGQVLLPVVCVATSLVEFLDLSHERVIEAEDVLVLLDKG